MAVKIYRITGMLLLSLFVTLCVFPQGVSAHCDAKDGPVGKAALEALETGDFTKVRIWVGPEQEDELRSAFERISDTRRQAPAAREALDDYFIETAIRLHREAEGMPYTGMRPAGAPVPEDVALADEALETGDIQPVVAMLQEKIEANVKEWFSKEQEARVFKDTSVAAGREWVDSYVRYIVYVHQLHQKIASEPAHGIED